MKVNQKQATVKAIMYVLEENGVEYEQFGETPVKDVLNDSMKAEVRDILFEEFKDGMIEYKASFQPKVDSDSELKKYISGLVNNWIRKAKEFNGNTTYKAKNPSSRAGSGDAKVKEMKKLLSVTTDATAREMIEQAIETRIAELKAEKNEVEIDINNLPEELRHLAK